MTIIGITGKKLSGKDTVCKYIQDYYAPKYSVVRVGFADALKIEIAEMLIKSSNLPKNIIATVPEVIKWMESNKPVFRQLYQWWGTDYKRNLFSSDYWVKKVLEDVRARDDKTIVVIPDVRFINESRCIRYVGGYLVKLIRPHQNIIDSHPSETEMDYIDADFEINNDGDLEYLKQQTEKLLIQINKVILI